MAETTMTERVGIEGFSLAALIWKKFRRQPAGYIERVMELNPGLSTALEVPLGTTIIFPMEDIEKPAKDPTVIRLWDTD